MANRDLWEPLLELALDASATVSFRWVKGHSGTRGTTWSTELAVEAAVQRDGARAPSSIVRTCAVVRSIAPMELNGTSAVVTGGASGLGAATARALAPRRPRSPSSTATRRAPRRSPRRSVGDYVAGDVTVPEDCQRAVDQAAEGGTLRIAVNCAGTGWVGRVINRDGTPHDLGAFEFIQQLNVIGTFNVMTRAASAMAATEPARDDGERGVIVNTASVAAFDGQIGQLAYSASKGAVVGMTLPAARDLAVVGHPGRHDRPRASSTRPLLAMLPDEQRAELGRSVLFPKRLGQPGAVRPAGASTSPGTAT